MKVETLAAVVLSSDQAAGFAAQYSRVPVQRSTLKPVSLDELSLQPR